MGVASMVINLLNLSIILCLASRKYQGKEIVQQKDKQDKYITKRNNMPQI